MAGGPITSSQVQAIMMQQEAMFLQHRKMSRYLNAVAAGDTPPDIDAAVGGGGAVDPRYPGVTPEAGGAQWGGAGASMAQAGVGGIGMAFAAAPFLGSFIQNPALRGIMTSRFMDPFGYAGRTWTSGIASRLGAAAGEGGFFSQVGAAMKAGQLGAIGRGFGGAMLRASPYAALWAAAQWGINRTQEGAQEYEGLSNMMQAGLQSRMPGITQGMTTAGAVGSIHGMMNEMVGQNPLMMNMGQLSGIMGQMMQSGTFAGSGNLSQFKQKFTQAVGQLKEIATIVGGTLQEAMPIMQEMSQMGIYKNLGAATLAFRGFAEVAQTTPGLMKQVSGMAATAARQMGLEGKTGAFAAAQTSAALGQLVSQGQIAPETLQEMAGGAPLAQAIPLVGAQFAGMGMQALGSQWGQQLMMGLYDQKTGGIDPGRLQMFMAGGLSWQDVTKAANKIQFNENVRTSFLAHKHTLTNQVLQQVSPAHLMAQQIRQTALGQYGRMGTADELTTLAMQQFTGLTGPQATMIGQIAAQPSTAVASQVLGSIEQEMQMAQKQMAYQRATSPSYWFNTAYEESIGRAKRAFQRAGAQIAEGATGMFNTAMENLTGVQQIGYGPMGGNIMQAQLQGDIPMLRSMGLTPTAGGGISFGQPPSMVYQGSKIGAGAAGGAGAFQSAAIGLSAKALLGVPPLVPIPGLQGLIDKYPTAMGIGANVATGGFGGLGLLFGTGAAAVSGVAGRDVFATPTAGDVGALGGGPTELAKAIAGYGPHQLVSGAELDAMGLTGAPTGGPVVNRLNAMEVAFKKGMFAAPTDVMQADLSRQYAVPDPKFIAGLKGFDSLSGVLTEFTDPGTGGELYAAMQKGMSMTSAENMMSDLDKYWDNPSKQDEIYYSALTKGMTPQQKGQFDQMLKQAGGNGLIKFALGAMKDSGKFTEQLVGAKLLAPGSTNMGQIKQWSTAFDKHLKAVQDTFGENIITKDMLGDQDAMLQLQGIMQAPGSFKPSGQYAKQLQQIQTAMASPIDAMSGYKKVKGLLFGAPSTGEVKTAFQNLAMSATASEYLKTQEANKADMIALGNFARTGVAGPMSEALISIAEKGQVTSTDIDAYINAIEKASETTDPAFYGQQLLQQKGKYSKYLGAVNLNYLATKKRVSQYKNVGQYLGAEYGIGQFSKYWQKELSDYAKTGEKSNLMVEDLAMELKARGGVSTELAFDYANTMLRIYEDGVVNKKESQELATIAAKHPKLLAGKSGTVTTGVDASLEKFVSNLEELLPIMKEITTKYKSEDKK